MDEQSDEWARYGRAVISAMEGVLAQADESVRPLLLETADYWLSLGLAVGTAHRDCGSRLLRLIEAEERNRLELEADGLALCDEVFG